MRSYLSLSQPLKEHCSSHHYHYCASSLLHLPVPAHAHSWPTTSRVSYVLPKAGSDLSWAPCALLRACSPGGVCRSAHPAHHYHHRAFACCFPPRQPHTFTVGGRVPIRTYIHDTWSMYSSFPSPLAARSSRPQPQPLRALDDTCTMGGCRLEGGTAGSHRRT